MHLLRTIPSDRIEPIQQQWRLVDNINARFVNIHLKMKPGGVLESIPEHARTITHLSTLIGGISIQGHEFTAEPAYRASSTMSERVRDQLGVSEPNMDGLERQRALQLQVQRDIREEMLKKLTPMETIIFLDNNSPAANAVLSMIPYHQGQHLTDKEIAVALTIKTLSLGAPGDHCLTCGAENTIEHDQSCMMKNTYRTIRHNRLQRHVLPAAVKSKQPTQTEFECTIPKNQPQDPDLRIDVRVKGPGALNSLATDTDISVTAVTTNASRTLLRRWIMDNGERADLQLENPYKFAEEFIREVLETRAREKIAKYGEKTPYPFAPLIITSGGWLHEVWYKWMVSLKPHLNMSRMYQKIGVILLQTRSLNFRLSY